ncbi:MAG: NADH-quinone oxidoreductase subunit C [bacterium]|nr:NADH-quinone oxidoreductase subunit C [bacterium]
MESLLIKKEELLAKAFELKKAAWQLLLVTGVDRGQTLQAVYHFGKHGAAELLQLTVDAGSQTPSVPSITAIFPLADWMERETYDMFGIRFEGHPNLTRLFLPDDFEGYPLRKDFVAFKRILPGG